MTKQTNILFICKHNVFRSRVAEAYFNKINKNKNIKASGAGFINANVLVKKQKEIVKFQKETAKKFGINIPYKPNMLTSSLIKKQDYIIIVANDIPKTMFNDKFYLKPTLKIIKWEIKDVEKGKTYQELVKRDIKEIMKKVDQLNKQLNKSQ